MLSWTALKCGRNVKLPKEQIVPPCHYWLRGSVAMHGVFEVYPTSLEEMPIHHSTDLKHKLTCVLIGKTTDS